MTKVYVKMVSKIITAEQKEGPKNASVYTLKRMKYSNQIQLQRLMHIMRA